MYVNAEKIPVRKVHCRVNSVVLLKSIKIERNLFKERVFGI